MSEGILVSQPVPASGETRRLNPVVRLLGRTLTVRRGQIGLALLALAVVAAVAGPHLAPFGVDDFVGAPFQPPDGSSLFGTDNLGRDVFSRALAGGGGLLWMSAGATLIAMVFGTAIGLIAGQSRGRLDGLLMRAMDVILAFPERVLVLLCVAIAGAGGLLLMVSVGLVFMPAIARASRAVTLDVAHKEFVQYAEAIGMPRRQILMREILPNILTPLMVEAGFRLTWAMGLIAGIQNGDEPAIDLCLRKLCRRPLCDSAAMAAGTFALTLKFLGQTMLPIPAHVVARILDRARRAGDGGASRRTIH